MGWVEPPATAGGTDIGWELSSSIQLWGNGGRAGARALSGVRWVELGGKRAEGFWGRGSSARGVLRQAMPPRAEILRRGPRGMLAAPIRWRQLNFSIQPGDAARE